MKYPGPILLSLGMGYELHNYIPCFTWTQLLIYGRLGSAYIC